MGRGGTARAGWIATGVAAVALLGCDAEDPSTEETLRDARAVSLGSHGIDPAPRLASLGALFSLPPGLDGSDPDALRRQAVGIVHDRLALTFAAIGCEAQLDTDGDRTVTVALSGCRLVLWTIDAEIEAVARVEADAVVWDLDFTEMATGLLAGPKSRFFGPAEIRAPLDTTAPLRWETFPGFVIETRTGLRFDTASTASWTTDADDCITLDLGARLSLEERPDDRDDLDEAIGNVIASVRGMQRCPGRCADAGQVQLSFGRGQVLSWTHDGSDTVTVTGPRGRELQARLPCADELSGAAAR